MSLIARIVARQRLALRPKILETSMTSPAALKSTGSAQHQMDEFWEKNRFTHRPMSPHLTIYKPQLTSMLSLTHRATGIMLAGATTAFAGATLLPSAAVDAFLSAVATVHASGMGYLCLFPLKFMLAWPVMFHVCNGLRHLLWDTALGLKLGEVYKTGWFVVVLSTILAAALSLALTTK